MTKNTPPKNKGVSYTYLKNTNLNFVRKLANKTGQTLSHCHDAIIDSVRTGKPLNIKEVTPKYVKRAEAYKKRRKQIK